MTGLAIVHDGTPAHFTETVAVGNVHIAEPTSSRNTSLPEPSSAFGNVAKLPATMAVAICALPENKRTAVPSGALTKALTSCWNPLAQGPAPASPPSEAPGSASSASMKRVPSAGVTNETVG